MDRIVFRSRMGGWVATSAEAAKVLASWGTQRLLTVRLPLPIWKSQYPTR